jgi:hypothetical protein
MLNTKKSLDQRISRIQSNPQSRDFILADAKDADMAFGITSPGHDANTKRIRTLEEFRANIREIVSQGLVDIMLMSVSTSDKLCIAEQLFAQSTVTPAIRANDSTEIWLAGSRAHYGQHPSLPFRSASIDHAMCGHESCGPEERRKGADLGLYSITFNNDAQLDRNALNEYKDFRIEAETKGFRHFLEVFAPNACNTLAPQDIPRFVNDSIVRTLAGIASAGRPLFLKMPYFGPRAMEELVNYDSSLVVGVLGGSAGTTMDAFHLLWEAKKYGARAALFGRKINTAEHQLTFVRLLRAIADDEIEPMEAAQEYHCELEKLEIRPHRKLKDDLIKTPTSVSYHSS